MNATRPNSGSQSSYPQPGVNSGSQFTYPPARPSSSSQPSYPQSRPHVEARNFDQPPSYSSIAPEAATFTNDSVNLSLPPPPPASAYHTYCFRCNQLSDHIEANCPTVHVPKHLLFCSICDDFGHCDADCQSAEAISQSILQPEVLYSAPPSIPKRPVQAAATSANDTAVPLKTAPTQLPTAPLVSAVTPARGKTIDLGKDMPKILEQMKSNKLPSYQHLKQQLCKNKPIKDVRSSMVNNKYLSDVKFIINGSPFYAHKMALITSSFLFYDHFHAKGNTELQVEFIDIETFELLIKYCYSEQLKVTEDNVLGLLKGANQLQIRQVTNVCHGFITNLMNADSIFVIFEKALEINYDIFQKKCIDFIQNNEGKCFASKGFFAISLPSLMKVLEACKYSREKENEIVEKWTNGGMGASEAEVEKPPVTQPAPATPKKATGSVPKAQKKKQQPPAQKIPPCPVNYNPTQPPPLIPDLMSLPVPDPNTGLPFPSPYSYEPAFMPSFPGQQFPQGIPINPQRPFAEPGQFSPGPQGYNAPNFGLIPPNPLSAPRPQQAAPKMKKPKAKPNPQVGNLIVVDDGDDDSESVNGFAGTKIDVLGVRHKHTTEFSRLDFVCTRSMMIHEIIFSENLAAKCKEINVTISTLEHGKPKNIHGRNVGVNSGKPSCISGSVSLKNNF